MPWDGSGNFTREHSWTSDKANNIKVTASRCDAEDNNFRLGIQTCRTIDGQNAATADLPMGSNKHTGVGNGTARNHYLAVGQFQDSGPIYGVDGGSADALTLTPAPAITAYAAGQRFIIEVANDNTGAATLAVSGLAATSIKKDDGVSDLAAGDIVDGQVIEVVHDGTNFQLVSPINKEERFTYNAQTGTTYTVQGTDQGKIITCTNASPITVTLPQNSTEALSAGFWCIVVQYGAGQVTFATEGSDTKVSVGSLNSTFDQYSHVFVHLQTAGSPNNWVLTGDMA